LGTAWFGCEILTILLGREKWDKPHLDKGGFLWEFPHPASHPQRMRFWNNLYIRARTKAEVEVDLRAGVFSREGNTSVDALIAGSHSL
jgi:hypothetical protein